MNSIQGEGGERGKRTEGSGGRLKKPIGRGRDGNGGGEEQAMQAEAGIPLDIGETG
jgi:hypothetical protein